MVRMHSAAMATPPVIAQRNVSSGIAILNLGIPIRILRRLSGPVCRLYLLAIGLLARLDRVGQGIFLPINHVAALFHDVACQAAGVFAEVRRLLLQEFLALIGLVLQNVAGFL